MEPELISAVRSLRRWTLAASVMLVAFLTLWLCTVIGTSVSAIANAARMEGDYEIATVFAVSTIIGCSFVGVLIGVPAWMLWQSHRWAADSAGTRTVQPLVRSIVWLRRFVVSTAVSALLFIAGIILITAIDLVRFFND